MNMISTGAFLTEMDASNKQHTIAEKFAAVWEKKNAKAARAGGVSLMALSLAACGSSSTTTTTTTDTTTSTDTTTTVTDAAKTLTGTRDIDVLTGGSGDDTFILDSNTASAGDTITGGDGTDTVKVYGATTTPTMSGVENLEMHHSTGANYNIGTGDLAAISKLTLDGLEVADETITIGAGDTVRIVDALDATAGTNYLDIAAATTVTSASFEFANSGTSATREIVLDIEGTKIATVNVTEDGSISKTFTSLTTATAGHSISTVNITATGKGIDFATIDDATTIDASASTAAVALDTAVNKVTVTTGSAADNVTFDHGATVAIETTVDLGEGADTFTLTSSNGAVDLVDNKVTIDGGAGEDTITMTNALADALTDLSATNYAKKGITNFEILKVSDIGNGQALDLVTPATGFKKLTLTTNIDADTTITLYDDSTLTLTSAASATNDTATITVSGAGDAGSNDDSFNLVLNSLHAANVTYGEMTVANVETVTINSTTTSTSNASSYDNDIDLAIANAKTVTVTGDTGLLLTGDAFDGVIETFDASGLTGNISVSFAGGSGVTYTAAVGVNTVTGSSNADLINGSAKGDTITAGDGIDVVNLGAKGAVDTLYMGGILATANRDTITNFDASSTTRDIIQFDSEDTAVTTATTATPVQQTVSALAASTTVADVDFVEFAFEAAVDLTSSSTGANFLKAISNTSSDASVTVDSEGDEMYAIAYQGGDAFLFYIQDATAADSDSAAIQSDEIFLVATISDVGVGELTMANFAGV